MNPEHKYGGASRIRRIGERSVTAIAYGAAGLSFDSRLDINAQHRALREAVDSGITLIDTARAYATASEDHHNERLIGKVLCSEIAAGSVMIATKGGHYRRGAEFPVDGTPAAVKADCVGSLRALGVDTLDLFFLHKPDGQVPFEDSIGALADLQRDGLVRSVGVSNVSPAQLEVATRITRIEAVENRFDPNNSDEVAILETARSAQIAYLSYSPLALALERPEVLSDSEILRIATTHNASVQQLVLAWTLSRGPHVIPVTGATRAESIQSSAKSIEIELSESEQLVLSQIFSTVPTGSNEASIRTRSRLRRQ
jgi:aryl-alcohol dehydrogenase-like predicted oxidoreductase